MAKYKLQVVLRTHSGTSSTTQEVNLPDHLDSKIGNSSYKNEIIAALEVNLPKMIGGGDWRKQGLKVESFNCVQRI